MTGPYREKRRVDVPAGVESVQERVQTAAYTWTREYGDSPEEVALGPSAYYKLLLELSSLVFVVGRSPLMRPPARPTRAPVWVHTSAGALPIVRDAGLNDDAVVAR